VALDEHGELGFISILVADSTRIHTQLLADAINKDKGLKVVATASTPDAVRDTVQRLPIDVIVLSYHMGNQPGRGTEILLELRSLRPQIKAIMLLDTAQPEAVLDCFRAGAKGIFSKEEHLETLCKCIRTVHDGQIWARSVELDHALETLASTPQIRAKNQKGMELLSPRERQVIEFVGAGMTNREIANALELSPHTVKNYLCKIFDKVGASSRTELLYLTMSHAPRRESPPANLAQSGIAEAAEMGDPWAQVRLAEYLAKPGTLQFDPAAASMWYVIARELTVALLYEIEEGKLRMRHQLSPDQQIEANHRAKGRLADWKKPTVVDSDPDKAKNGAGS
jgi:DNA-binding NarL/FixJ family response regulator